MEHEKRPDSPCRFLSPLTGEMYHPDSVVNLHKKILKNTGFTLHAYAPVARQKRDEAAQAMGSVLGQVI